MEDEYLSFGYSVDKTFPFVDFIFSSSFSPLHLHRNKKLTQNEKYRKIMVISCMSVVWAGLYTSTGAGEEIIAP